MQPLPAMPAITAFIITPFLLHVWGVTRLTITTRLIRLMLLPNLGPIASPAIQLLHGYLLRLIMITSISLSIQENTRVPGPFALIATRTLQTMVLFPVLIAMLTTRPIWITATAEWGGMSITALIAIPAILPAAHQVLSTTIIQASR